MTGGTRIIALDGSQVDADQAGGGHDDGGLPITISEDLPEQELDDEAPFAVPGRLRLVVPALAVLLGLGWTVLFALARAPLLRGGVTPGIVVT